MSLEIADITEHETAYVMKANSLIQVNKFIGNHAGKSLTLLELKLLAYGLSLLDTHAEHLHPVEFSVQDFWRSCNITPRGKKYYTMIAEALQNIRNRSAWMLRQNEKTRRTEAVLVSWVLKAKIKDDRCTCYVEFDPDLEPALLSLKANYLRYPRKAVMTLQSKYGFYLYELLASYEKQNHELSFEISKLIELIDISHYSTPSEIWRTVVQPAIKDINSCENNNMLVSAELQKVGKKVSNIVFSIKDKYADCQSDSEDAPEKHETIDQVREQINAGSIYADMLAEKIQVNLTTLNLIQDIIDEVLYHPKDTYSINKRRIQKHKVQEQFALLGEREVRYVLDSIKNSSEPVRNPRSYICAMLFNAPSSVEFYEMSKMTASERKQEEIPRGASGTLGEAELEAIAKILQEG